MISLRRLVERNLGCCWLFSKYSYCKDKFSLLRIRLVCDFYTINYSHSELYFNSYPLTQAFLLKRMLSSVHLEGGWIRDIFHCTSIWGHWTCQTSLGQWESFSESIPFKECSYCELLSNDMHKVHKVQKKIKKSAEVKLYRSVQWQNNRIAKQIETKPTTLKRNPHMVLEQN